MSSYVAIDPRLERIESLFWKLIVAPEGVERGLEALVSSEVIAPDLVESWFLGDERLSARGRLDIYANMYFYRIKDALKEDLPKVAEILGETRWHNLVTDFLLVHPSSHPSLRYVGRPLGEYLRTHELVKEFPYLADLASLEWVTADVFQTANGPVLDRGALAAVAPEKWPDVKLRLAAAHRLLPVSWDVVGLWDRLEAGEGAGAVDHRAAEVLIYRPDDEVRHEEVSPDEAAALRALERGAAFGEICELLATGEDVEAAAERAAGLLGRWIGLGLIAGFEV